MFIKGYHEYNLITANIMFQFDKVLIAIMIVKLYFDHKELFKKNLENIMFNSFFLKYSLASSIE